MGDVLNSGDLHEGHYDLGPCIMEDPTLTNNNAKNIGSNGPIGSAFILTIGKFSIDPKIPAYWSGFSNVI